MNKTLTERKDLADIISKRADILYKKLIVLIAICGGLGSFALTLEFSLFRFLVSAVFAFLAVGVVINYFWLNKADKKIKDLEDE